MKTNALLVCLNSKIDKNGNCYYAFIYTDNTTEKVVQATISGGESNIYAIRGACGMVLHGKDGWNDGIRFSSEEMPIRKFDQLTKGWEYAGCRPETLAQFIKTKLEEA